MKLVNKVTLIAMAGVLVIGLGISYISNHDHHKTAPKPVVSISSVAHIPGFDK